MLVHFHLLRRIRNKQLFTHLPVFYIFFLIGVCDKSYVRSYLIRNFIHILFLTFFIQQTRSTTDSSPISLMKFGTTVFCFVLGVHNTSSFSIPPSSVVSSRQVTRLAYTQEAPPTDSSETYGTIGRCYNVDIDIIVYVVTSVTYYQ